MLTDDEIFDFATSAAKIYCARFGSSGDLDDAVGDICLYLFENPSEREKPLPVLKKRVVLELVRQYQNKHGKRLKRPPKRTEFSENVASSRDEEYDEILERERRVRKLEAATRALGDSDRRAIVAEILAGKKKGEIAKERGISAARLSQIIAEFKLEVARASEKGGVEIVETRAEDATPEQIASSPLFFCR